MKNKSQIGDFIDFFSDNQIFYSQNLVKLIDFLTLSRFSVLEDKER